MERISEISQDHDENSIPKTNRARSSVKNPSLAASSYAAPSINWKPVDKP